MNDLIFVFSPLNKRVPYMEDFRSEAKDLLGDDWVQRHRRIVQQHANQYKRIAWAKVCFYIASLFLVIGNCKMSLCVKKSQFQGEKIDIHCYL